MKIIKYSFLLVFLMLVQNNLSGRGNPIMVIELDCGIDEAVTAQLISFSCPDENALDGGCPEGYRRIDPDGCECVPDCEVAAMINALGDENAFGDCPDCPGFLEWNYFDQICVCNDPDVSYDNCGCPPWLEVNFQVTDGDYSSANCIVATKPCYEGAIAYEFIDDGCGSVPNAEGKILTRIRITAPGGAMLPVGSALTLEELENCEFFDDSDIILGLDEYAEANGRDVALVVDDTGFIELIFYRMPDASSILTFGTQMEPLEIQQCALAPIPTLTTWTIIGLALILAISGLLFIKRKEVRKALHTMMLSF